MVYPTNGVLLHGEIRKIEGDASDRREPLRESSNPSMVSPFIDKVTLSSEALARSNNPSSLALKRKPTTQDDMILARKYLTEGQEKQPTIDLYA